MRFVSSIIYSILIGLVLLSCSNVATIELQVRECARMPEARAAASASAIGNMGYVFGGRNAQNEPTADLWQYDADADQWTSLGNTPLLPRVNAAMCADDNYLYVGLGFGGKHYDEDSTYYRDFWRYSPTDNTFSRLRDFPSDATDRPVTLMLDGKIYFFFGWKDEFNRDVYIYDINADSWEKQTFDLKKNDFPPRVYAATGAV